MTRRLGGSTSFTSTATVTAAMYVSDDPPIGAIVNRSMKIPPTKAQISPSSNPRSRLHASANREREQRRHTKNRQLRKHGRLYHRQQRHHRHRYQRDRQHQGAISWKIDVSTGSKFVITNTISSASKSTAGCTIAR